MNKKFNAWRSQNQLNILSVGGKEDVTERIILICQPKGCGQILKSGWMVFMGRKENKKSREDLVNGILIASVNGNIYVRERV